MRYSMSWLRFLLPLPLLCVYSIQVTISLSISNSSRHLCNHKDSTALLHFARECVIDSSDITYDRECFPSSQTSYPNIRSWRDNTDCCSWDGVTCDSLSGHVTDLDLSCGQISGIIDSNSTLFQLQHLQRLNLAFNDFRSSTISSEFGNFSHLRYLNLSNAGFSGEVSIEISKLSKLISLDLSLDYNYPYDPLKLLDLALITKSMTGLTQLHLSNVLIINSVIPPSLANLSFLSSLVLENCGLQGNFPLAEILHFSHIRNLVIVDAGLNADFSVLNWTSSLEVLTLSSPNFTGKLPESPGPTQFLRELNLYDSNFYGVIPPWVWNTIDIINLSQNQFSGELPSLLNTSKLSKTAYIDLSSNKLSGKIPHWVWNIVEVNIDLSQNQFSGELPSSLNTSQLSEITSLNLYSNMLSGKIPSWVWSMAKINIDLSQNQFSGELPSLLNTSKLTKLTYLDLYSNMLTGKIPYWVWNIAKQIDLSQNQFSGELPSLINTSTLSDISDIDFSKNKLSGKIPPWLFTLPSLSSLVLRYNRFSGQLVIEYVNPSQSLLILDLGYNMVNGSIPTSISRLQSLSELYLDFNELNGTVDFSVFYKLHNLTKLMLWNNSLSLSFNDDTPTQVPQFKVLGLSSCNLRKFPDFLIYQDNLFFLDLANNRIHGQVPRWLFKSNVLTYLDLSSNYLTGGLEHIPWDRLNSVDLSYNMFKGPLPRLTPNMISYLFSNNELTGEIPSTVCSSILQFLDLSKNNLTGQIPRCLGNMSDQLIVLNLRLNKFQGTLPTNFANCRALKIMNINGNQLEGLIPPSLGGCSSLKVLDLGNNKLRGTFPRWLGSLTELKILVLHSNRLKGHLITDVESPFPKLQILDIANNQFSGNLPYSLIKCLKAMMTKGDGDTVMYMSEHFHSLSKHDYMDSIHLTFKGFDRDLDRVLSVLVAIDVSGNVFQGEIPNDVGDLVSLRWLNVSNNNFSGIIPSSLSNLAVLESLDISSNELVGQIPKELASLTSLAFFNASRNELSGPIPVGEQFDTFGNESYLKNVGLCGIPLSKKCGNDGDATTKPPPTESPDSIHISFWEMILMGYGCGMIAGLVIGCFVILAGTPFCLSRLIYRVELTMEQYLLKRRRRPLT